MQIQQTLTAEQWEQVKQNVHDDYQQALRCYTKAGRSTDKLTKQYISDLDAIDTRINNK